MNYKTIIAPIVTVLALAYGTITGHAVSASLQNEIISIGGSVVGAAVSIWGIVKNHKKEV